jgi:hypothetical protein
MPGLPESSAGPGFERSIRLGRAIFQLAMTVAPVASAVFGPGLIMVYSGVATPFPMLRDPSPRFLIAGNQSIPFLQVRAD